METRTLSFLRLGIKNFDLLGDGNEFTFEELDGLRRSNHIKDKNFVAIVGDGDDAFETGEILYKLSDTGYGGRVTTLATENDYLDPVHITAHGRLNNGNIGDLTHAVRFAKDGFGLDNGPDGSLAKYLNSGDSLTFDSGTTGLAEFSFTVQLKGDSGTGALLFDIDGNVMTTADGQAEGAAKRGQEVSDALAELDGLEDGQSVVIDFVNSRVLVDGEVRDGFEALFDAARAAGTNALTIGSSSGTPVALDAVNLEITDGPVNAPPVTVIDIFELDEDGSYTFTAADLLANDSDPNGDTLSLASGFTFGESANPEIEGGTITDNGDGTFTFRPSQDAQDTLTSGDLNGEYFTYEVSDGFSGVTQSAVVFNVNGVNRYVPDVKGELITWYEGQVLSTVNLLANDSDADGDALTIVAIDDDPTLVGNTFISELGAEVTIQSDGTFTYDATDAEVFAASGNDSFTYTVSDGNGRTSEAEASLLLEPSPDGAAMGGDLATDVTEDIANASNQLVASGVATISDPDDNGSNGLGEFVAETLTGAHGTLEIAADGSWTYTANNGSAAIQGLGAGVSAVDSFTVTQKNIVNGFGAFGGETATIDVSIHGVNDAPDLRSELFDTNEGAIFNTDLLANDTDVDGDTLTITAVDGLSGRVGNSFTSDLGAEVTINADGTILYDATNAEPAGFSGVDSFTYSVSDGNGGTSDAEATFHVEAVNDDPDAIDFEIATDAETPITFSFLELGLVDPDIEDTHQVVDFAYVSSTNSNGYFISAGSLNDNANGTFTYTPDPDAVRLGFGENGADIFSFTIEDAANASDTGYVKINFTGIDDPLVVVDDTVTTDEDQSITIDVLANDIDPDEGESGTLTSLTQPTNGTATIVNGQILYAPDMDFHGEDSFTYEVAGANGEVETATVTVTVDPVNDDPVAGVLSFAITEDESLTLTAAQLLDGSTDVDGDILSIVGGFGGITASNAPEAGGEFRSNSDNTYSYVHGPNAQAMAATDTAVDFITFTVSDGNGGTSEGVMRIDVSGANDAPDATGDFATTIEDAQTPIVIDVLANDTDIDGDTLSITSVYGASAGGLAEIIDNKIHYTPGKDFFGGNYLTYTVSDGAGGTDTATVSVTVSAVPDKPIANEDMFRKGEAATVVNFTDADLLANDSDPDLDSFWVVDGSLTHVSGADTLVELSDGSYAVALEAAEYLVQNDYVEAVYSYTITDGSLTSDPAYIRIRQEGQNDAPIAIDDVIEAEEDVTAVLTHLLDNDTDVDNFAELSILSVESTGSGTAELQTDGSVHYTSAANFVGVDRFTYVVTDEKGATDTATVTVNVGNTPDAPTGVDDSATLREDTSISIDVLANDFDIDGDAVSLVSAGNGTDGMTEIVDGKVVYTPNADFNGSDSFTYVVSDGTLSDTATVNVTVTDEPPEANSDTFSTGDNTPLNVNILDNDSDPDDDLLTVVALERNGWDLGVGVRDGDSGIKIDADGSLSFDPNGRYEFALSHLEEVTYTIEDSHGNQSTTNVRITIYPENDSATFGGDLTGDVTDDGGEILITSGKATVTDPDEFFGNDNGSFGSDEFSSGTYTGAYGSLTIDKDGNWTYEAVRDQSDIIELAVDQSLTDSVTVRQTAPSFGYTYVGGEEVSIDITIHGGNDAPTPSGDSYEIGDNELLTANVLANDSDPDSDMLRVVSVDDGNSGSVDAGEATGFLGLVITEDGALSFNAEALSYFDTDVTYTETVTYTVEDTHGARETASIQIKVTPEDDLATFGGELSGEVTEDTNLDSDDFLFVSGNATVVDPDNFFSNSAGDVSSGFVGANHFLPEDDLAGTYGTLSIDYDGNWTYRVDNSLDAIQDLDTGQSLVDSIDVEQVDSTLVQGLGGAITTIDITIYGLDEVA